MDLLSKIREEILSHPHLEERLSLCQPSGDTPDWWQPGKHDKELLLGAAKHGLGRTDITILNDPDFSFHKTLSKSMYSNIQSSKIVDKSEKAIKIENREDILKFDKDEILVKLEKGEGTLKIEKVGAKKDKDVNMADKRAENVDSEKSQVELTIIKAENKVEEKPISNALTITTIPRSTPADKEQAPKVKTEEKSEVVIESVKPEVSKADPVTTTNKTDETKVSNATITVEETPAAEVENESQAKETDTPKEIEKEAEEEKPEEPPVQDAPKETAEKCVTEQKESTETTEKAATESNENTTPEDTKASVKADPPVIKEEAETQEGKTAEPPKDKAKVCKLEDKCSVQAAELKAMFPDLEVIQPLSRLTQIDTFVLRDKAIDYNEPTVVQLLSHNSNNAAKWPKVTRMRFICTNVFMYILT